MLIHNYTLFPIVLHVVAGHWLVTPTQTQKFVMQQGIPEDTAMRVYRRYLKLMPQHAEEFIAYLRLKGRWGEVASKLAEVVDDDTFRSMEGKTKHQLWLELCDVITKHPKEVTGLKVDAILRSGIRRFTDEVPAEGVCWQCIHE